MCRAETNTPPPHTASCVPITVAADATNRCIVRWLLCLLVRLFLNKEPPTPIPCGFFYFLFSPNHGISLVCVCVSVELYDATAGGANQQETPSPQQINNVSNAHMMANQKVSVIRVLTEGGGWAHVRRQWHSVCTLMLPSLTKATREYEFEKVSVISRPLAAATRRGWCAGGFNQSSGIYHLQNYLPTLNSNNKHFKRR